MKTVNVKSLGECPYLISLESEDAIGHGSYANVCRAYNKKNPEEKLAAKIFDLHDTKKFESALKELIIVSDLPKHDNLIEYKKVKITSKNRLYIIMELCESSLKKQIAKRKEPFAEKQVWNFLIQFAEGYKILNKKSIMHRDIKPDNILLGYDGKYKITDFGLAEIISEISTQQKKVKGSLCYLAPQLLQPYQNQSVNCMNDVYSLGVTVFEMCFKRLPYVKSMQNLDSINKFVRQVQQNKLKFPSNHSYSDDLINLLSSMLEKQQSKRCTWEYIFFVLMKKSLAIEIKLQQSQVQQKGQKKFRIIQISDAFLKNLSYLDTDLYNSLANQSLAIIDHVQAQIVAKRQIVFFCDRLQYRLQIINSKLKSNMFSIFSYKLLILTYLLSQHLEKYFEKYYEKVEKSQFMKVVASQKYTYIRNLVRQDYLSLKGELQNYGQENKQKNPFPLVPSSYPQYTLQSLPAKNVVETELYASCYDLITELYKWQYYEECKQVDELEKWLQNKDKSVGLLAKLRKNENALKQFDQSICNLSKEQLKECISGTYVYQLNLIDKQSRNK